MAYNKFQCFMLLKSGESKKFDMRTKSTRQSKIKALIAKDQKIPLEDIVVFQAFRIR